MFSQQNKGIIKGITPLESISIEMSQEVSRSHEFPDKHPNWKLALVEPLFQSQLGVTSGDTIILRRDMLSKPIACIVADYYPIADIGMKIIRLSNFAKEKLNCGNNYQIFVEKWEKIFSKKLILEYFIETWSLDQQLEHSQLLQKLERDLPEIVKNELNSLPVTLHDYFQTSVNIKNREHPLNVDYWIKKVSPDFPITSVTKDTKIEVKSRAKRIRNKL